MFTDSYPDKPKILFIGNPDSSHVQGWINLLLGGEFNVRLFACTDGWPPVEWEVKTYIISQSLPDGLDVEWRETWWPMPEDWYAYNEELNRYTEKMNQHIEKSNRYNEELNRYNEDRAKAPRIHKFFDKFFYRIFKIHPLFPEFPEFQGVPPVLPVPPQSRTASPEEWLAEAIKSWRPDIIHTIGLDEGSDFYFRVRNQYELAGYGKWIIKVFGGSDVAFKIFDRDSQRAVKTIFAAATHVLFDNQYYPQILIKDNILEPEKICPLTPIPGSGGVDVDDLHSRWSMPSSARRIIVWPKSYETIWSKAMPVLFALKNVWDRIQPCEVYMLATNSEIKQWLPALPIEMQAKLHVFEGVPRKDVLDIMVKSRLLLAPSLVDGMPNSLYEAMACGVLPIVSPIPTITSVVDKMNVLFANNLDQPGLEDAIIKAMTDDALIDEYAERNLKLVKELADIKKIQPKVVAYYKAIL